MARQLIVGALGQEAYESACAYAIRRGVITHLIQSRRGLGGHNPLLRMENTNNAHDL